MKTGILWTIAFGLCATAYSSPNEGPELEIRSAEPDTTSSFSSSYISSLKRLTRGVRKLSVRADSCPAVWNTIAVDLKASFAGCNRAATDAIRFSFHDAAGYSSTNAPSAPASGGADGSLLLSDAEIARSTNDPLQGFRNFLLGKYNIYKNQGVSAADFVQAAGNIGVVSCGGPVVQTVIGRKDASGPAPDGTLPQAFGKGSDHASLVQLWADKGFSQRELAALMGAHSVSRAFRQQQNGIPTGGQQDDSPRKWDTRYFSQTQAKTAPRGVFRFASDVNLANPNTTSGEAFTEFANNAGAWATAFQSSMYKLSILGLPADTTKSLKDCTGIVG
ncbi:hypothetical protein MBLNU13_g07257t1 [Cladosporium sp. NU13]